MSGWQQRAFIARFDGDPCWICDQPVRTGDEVYRSSVGIVHTCCPTGSRELVSA